MHVNLDPQLVDKIAYEVKSQGVFDQFRKDSMADVDTKPAYQNLRQRVENTVNKFLADQRWTPDMNKNHLRERLRKHITEAGFLDTGVERIVDQVVNPKIATVFQPKIEDIAYKYLGIPKPQPQYDTSQAYALNGALQIETDLLPTDLEQVSPDSDKCTVKSDSKDDMETDEKLDDFESPPFEPIETSTTDRLKVEAEPEQEEQKPEVVAAEVVTQTTESFVLEPDSNVKDEQSIEEPSEKLKIEDTSTPVKAEEEAAANVSGEATQESQLSQVSSDSRLSIVTNENTQDEQSTACEIKEESNVNISEEAQMPKFNENSNSNSEKTTSEPLHFDIKKDEIKFEGTERKTEPPAEAMSPNTSDEQPMDSSLENKTLDSSQNLDIPLPSHEFSFEKEGDFKFSKIEVKVDLEEVTKTTSLDDSVDRELHIIEKSEMSQCSMSEQSMKSPMMPKLGKQINSPSVTSSPLQKSSHRDRDHSSSSSRHKKHSKDRRSDKDRDRHSSSSHRASSSKYHSSSKSSSGHRVSGTSSDHHHHHHRSSSSSVYKSKHTSRNGKSSRSHHDSKDSRSRDHSKSRSDKTREKSSKERSDRSKPVDDHYSSKQKWRKSTDSNDEGDSSQEGTRTSGPKDSSVSQENGTNGTLNSHNTSSGTTNNPSGSGGNVDLEAAASSTAAPASKSLQNIVILDNLLENPNTNFIEINNANIQVNSAESQPTSCSYDGEFLYYFDHDISANRDAAHRVQLLTNLMENCRMILQPNSVFGRASSTPRQLTDCGQSGSEIEGNCVNRPESVSPTRSATKRRFESPTNPPTLTSATLTIDCIQYRSSPNEVCLSKRFKFDGNAVTKVSPTPSEVSANSKENEFVDKNAQSDTDSLGSRDNRKTEADKVIATKRKSIVSQRYSSEDLYKPRPILSQRSRRRGLDAVI